ncbi:MAG: ubiquinol-cytochrome c reductase iron-sulfur subunit [Hyphomonadaceae bacterium]|nr:ubiquinol-cytochrome c reductase iron-sulfur subunit [Hyphomonadaceae bacterium]
MGEPSRERAVSAATNQAHAGEEGTRRDFIYIAAGAAAAVGAAATIWPFIDQMNPAADTLALSTTEVDLSAVVVGQQIKVMWQGKPVFVRHRTAAEIAAAQRDDYANLKDPQHDAERLLQENGQPGKAEWLILQASCTHLGCVPTFVTGSSYGGWFCPCHGSDYDTSGRIRRGPAPRNLDVAPYVFVTDTSIRIG